LRLNWYDTLLVQTLANRGHDRRELRREQPVSGGGYQLNLKAVFTRKKAILPELTMEEARK